MINYHNINISQFYKLASEISIFMIFDAVATIQTFSFEIMNTNHSFVIFGYGAYVFFDAGLAKSTFTLLIVGA